MANLQAEAELPPAPEPSRADWLPAHLWGHSNPHPLTQNTLHAAQAQHSNAHLPVAEVQANHELLEDPARVDLQQAAVGLLPQQVLEQVPTLSKLHGDAQMGGREEHLQGSRHSSQGCQQGHVQGVACMCAAAGLVLNPV